MERDLHNINQLQEECQIKISNAIKELARLYCCEQYNIQEQDCNDIKNNEKWQYKILVKQTIEKQEIQIIVCVPKAFPYDFPKIYLHSSHKDFYEKIPHIDDDLNMCIFDKNEVNPDPIHPFEFLDITIKRAFSNIEQGLLKKNFTDFKDEIQAYWNIDNDYKVLSILNKFEPYQELIAVNLVSLREIYKKKPINDIDANYNLKKLKSYSYIVANDIVSLTKYLSNLGIIVPREEFYNIITKSLFIILDEISSPPFPETNSALLKFLAKYSNKSLPYLQNFLEKNKRPVLIVFGYKNKKQLLLGAWRYNIYKFLKIIGKDKKYINELNGFRKNKQPVSIELRSNDTRITRFSVERVDKERLYKRGGNGIPVNNLYKINLIGCGSIGSFLAENLIKIGFNSFVFLDEDCLGSENLARHYCDIKYLYQQKSQSLKQALCEKYPFLDIDYKVCNLNYMLLNNLEFFNCADLTIVAIADFKTELLLNKAYKLNLIKTPILVIWVEPFLNSGNAVLLLPNKKGCLKCLFNIKTGDFLYAKNKTNNFILYKEFGCHSTYLPYGSNDISLFTNYVSRIVYKISKNHYKDNYLFQIEKDCDNLNFKVTSTKFKDLKNIHFCCEDKNNEI